MRASCDSPSADRPRRAGFARGIVTGVALALMVTLGSPAGAGALPPVTDPGGPGGGAGGDTSVAEQLRGDYSPIDITQEIAVTDVNSPMSVAEMLRGDNSPVDAAPESAVTSVVSVVEQLRGDYSPIVIG